MTNRLRATIGVLPLLFLLGGCSDDTPVERSFKDDLELRLGRELSPAEVVEFKDSAELLCELDLDVLKEVWTELDEDQFAFQTFVFTEECPERESAYRQARIALAENAPDQATTTTSTTLDSAEQSTTSTTRQ